MDVSPERVSPDSWGIRALHPAGARERLVRLRSTWRRCGFRDLRSWLVRIRCYPISSAHVSRTTARLRERRSMRDPLISRLEGTVQPQRLSCIISCRRQFAPRSFKPRVPSPSCTRPEGKGELRGSLCYLLSPQPSSDKHLSCFRRIGNALNIDPSRTRHTSHVISCAACGTLFRCRRHDTTKGPTRSVLGCVCCFVVMANMFCPRTETAHRASLRELQEEKAKGEPP